jgi:hypothetical protein
MGLEPVVSLAAGDGRAAQFGAFLADGPSPPQPRFISKVETVVAGRDVSEGERGLIRAGENGSAWEVRAWAICPSKGGPGGPRP